jgi:ABC-2 type transport system permease protein
MRASFTIAAKDLRQRFRDRSAIVLGFVAPLAIAVLMSFAFQGVDNLHVTIGVVNNDSGAIGTGFVDALHAAELRDVATVRPVATQRDAEAKLRSRDIDVALVIPAGFSDAVTSGAANQVAVLSTVDAPIAGQVAQSIVDSFVAQLNADRLSVATALSAGAPASSIQSLVASAASLRLPVGLENHPAGAKRLKAISYFAPAMGIFFVFFAINFTARGYFVERREGTLERMIAAVRPTTVLAGKAMAVFVYGSASLATMVLFTSVVFHADWGGSLTTILLCLGMIVCVVSLTAFVIVLARTERQAEALASIVVFSLALLGGNFMFVSASPAIMRKLALFTPNGWALRGFVDGATGASTLQAVGAPLLGMAAFATVALVTTTILARRRLVG